MAEVSDIAVPVAAVAGTGISVTWIAKMLINRWMKNQEDDSKLLRDIDKQLAVVVHRLGKVEGDINGLGNAMRARLQRKECGDTE